MISPNPNETYEEWVERSRQYELDLALEHIAQGGDPKQVLERMTHRLLRKMLFPLYSFEQESFQFFYNTEIRKEEYYEYLRLKNLKPKGDHVVDDK